MAGAYSTTKEGGTVAFRDRLALTGFIRQHWKPTSRRNSPQ
jgi:hypothetical protein